MRTTPYITLMTDLSSRRQPKTGYDMKKDWGLIRVYKRSLLGFYVGYVFVDDIATWKSSRRCRGRALGNPLFGLGFLLSDVPVPEPYTCTGMRAPAPSHNRDFKGGVVLHSDRWKAPHYDKLLLEQVPKGELEVRATPSCAVFKSAAVEPKFKFDGPELGLQLCMGLHAEGSSFLHFWV